MNQFKSTHNLDFEIAPWYTAEFQLFRIGTCEGLWGSDAECYLILAILNNEPGNGHFEDVLEWFENSCCRDKKRLRILEIDNSGLMVHLIEKRGFKKIKGNNVEKTFSKTRISENQNQVEKQSA